MVSMRSVCVLLALSFAVVACGDDDGGGVEEGVRETIEGHTTMLERGQWGRMWEQMHPAHQDEVSKAEFEQCSRSDMEGAPSVSIDDVKIIETYEERVTIPGTDVETDSLAVTWSARYSAGEESQSSTETTHLVDVDGEWRWYLADLNSCATDV